MLIGPNYIFAGTPSIGKGRVSAVTNLVHPLKKNPVCAPECNIPLLKFVGDAGFVDVPVVQRVHGGEQRVPGPRGLRVRGP